MIDKEFLIMYLALIAALVIFILLIWMVIDIIFRLKARVRVSLFGILIIGIIATSLTGCNTHTYIDIYQSDGTKDGHIPVGSNMEINRIEKQSEKDKVTVTISFERRDNQ